MGYGSFRSAAAPASLWLRASYLGCIFFALLAAMSPSCVVSDPEYCAISANCPMVDGENGPVQLVCNTFRHVCVSGSCFADSDCTDFAAPHCDRDSATCTSCRADDAGDTSCAHFVERPRCVTKKDDAGTICAACQKSADCPFTAPICDNYQCRKCSAHTECEGPLVCDDNSPCTDSLVCIKDGDLSDDRAGRCAQNGGEENGRVIYVNNQSACSDTNPGNLPAMPACTLDAGLTLATVQKRRFIRVVGKDLKKLNLTVSSGVYSFIGAPTRDFAETATIEGLGVLFTVKDTGALTLDQLHLVQDLPNNSLVLCLGIGSVLPKLTLRNSILSGATPPSSTMVGAGALSIGNCNTILDGNIIGVSTMDALSDPLATAHGAALVIVDTANLRGSSYLIENNIIAGNAGVAINLSGVSSDSAKFVMRFNTLTGNGRAVPGTGSVLCPVSSSTMEFSHSIVFNNSTFAGGSQFLFPQSCGLKNLIVGKNETGTDPLFNKTPDLDAMFRLRSSAANTDCCIDKAAPATGESFPRRDVDQRPRPQGTKWDIGASELAQ